MLEYCSLYPMRCGRSLPQSWIFTGLLLLQYMGLWPTAMIQGCARLFAGRFAVSRSCRIQLNWLSIWSLPVLCRPVIKLHIIQHEMNRPDVETIVVNVGPARGKSADVFTEVPVHIVISRHNLIRYPGSDWLHDLHESVPPFAEHFMHVICDISRMYNHVHCVEIGQVSDRRNAFSVRQSEVAIKHDCR